MKKPKKLLAVDRHPIRRCRCGKLILDVSMGITNYCSVSCQVFFTEVAAKMLELSEKALRKEH